MVDALNIYIKHKMSTILFDKVCVYIMCKQVPSSQLLLTFHKESTGNFYMNTTIFEKYIKLESKDTEISQFGNPEEIITTLIKFQITALFKSSDNDLDFIISMCRETDDPNITNTILYRLDRTGFNLDECPICRIPWSIKNPINLPCKHKVCCDCMMGLVRNHSDTCPVCRAPYI